MPTHAFSDPADYTKGGTWFGDYGRHFCRWTWNVETRELTVIKGPHGKRIDLSALGQPTPEELKTRLPAIALEAGQRIAEESKVDESR
jgi:hypothetical protein